MSSTCYKYDVLVIGGGPAGVVTAMTAAAQHKDKSTAIIQKGEKQLVPCGIPYIFSLLDDPEKNLMKRPAFNTEGKDLFVGTVKEINTVEKSVKLKQKTKIFYDKLVIATGSKPWVPDFLKINSFVSGIEMVSKNFPEIEQLKKKTDSARDIIVLGSGFTAVEMAEQLSNKKGKNITLVFRAENCLHKAFSPDYAAEATKNLSENGVNVKNKSQIKAISNKNGHAGGIILDDGTEIKADLIISALGFFPETEIAREAGIRISEKGFIEVDNYQRTNVKDVFAVGDCAQTTAFITGRKDNIMLASTAAAEARVLGHNLYRIRIKRDFSATLSAFATELNGTVFASAGILEKNAESSNIDYITGCSEAPDRHPGTIPGTRMNHLKLIVMPEDGQIIGAELKGTKSSAEIINTVALAIQKNVTVYELISFQMATHPLINTAPTKSVLIKAAENAIKKMIR
jgi:NADPH-dependent 2,4-dienoyl-CoA reductase/sulfur reductase-like enzyme